MTEAASRPRDGATGHDVQWGRAPSGYRLPAGTQVGTVRLQVADLERSIAWYRQLLGMELLDSAGGRATLGTQPGETVLLELRERAGAVRAPRHGRLGLYHFAILLPARAALGAFLAHLQRIGVAAGAADHLVSEALYLHDPDGLGIEVYADRPRASWRHRDRELLMDTRALDTDDLLHSAAGQEWTGLPAGASMGHVHLHVGDIAEARAFYHEALGFDTVVWSYPGALFLSAGGYHHHLGVNTWAAGAPPAAEDDARLIEWELVVPERRDAVAALDSVAAAGYDVPRGVDSRGSGHANDEGVAHDPWGTAVRIRWERDTP